MKNKRYLTLVVVGLVLWLAETAYFGFNNEPENGLEAALDFITAVMIGWGIIGDLLTNVRIVKHEHYITNTKKLNYIDQRKNGKTVVGAGKGSQV